MATRRRGKAAPEPVVEEDVFEDIEPDADDLDDLDEVEDAEPEPAKPARGRKATKAAPAKATKAAKAAAPAKAAPAARESSGFDSNWLAEYVNAQCGTGYDARAIRMLLRKMASAGELDREVGTDRSRYDFPKGENDPTVRKVIKAVKSGAIETARKENIEAAQTTAKATKAARKTAKAAAPAKTTTRRRTRAAAE